jgi:hypothetical protein
MNMPLAPPFSRLMLSTEATSFDAGAERVALEFAQRCGLPLHVVLPFISNAEAELVAPELQQRAESALAARLERLREAARDRGVSATGTIRLGEDGVAGILDEARAAGADLIVMRRRGKRGFLAKLLVGEMVLQVIERAPCHALLVPTAARWWTQRVLLASDGSPDSRRAAQLAACLARCCGLPLSVIAAPERCETGSAAAQERLASALASLAQSGIAAQGCLGAGRPGEAILEAARRFRADLIVLGRRGGGAHARRASLGSAAQEVAGGADCPVLIARA